jgi:hypothetical protein
MAEIADIERRLYAADMTPANPEYQNLLGERARLYAVAYPKK